MKPIQFSFLKHWFKYAYTERSATYALLFLVTLLALFPFFYDAYLRPEKDFKIDQILVNQLEKKQEEKQFIEQEKFTKTSIFQSKTNLNQAEWKNLIKVGIDHKIANGIINFGKAIKGYKNWEQVVKVYGMNEQNISILRTHFFIEEQAIEQDEKTTFTTTEKKPRTALEINDADSASLTKIYGIGAFTAGKIVQLRNQLGGFYKKEQILEIYGMKDSNFQKIKEQLLCNGQTKKININYATEEQLAAHAYIKWKTAKRIISYRSQHNKIANWAEFSKATLLDESAIEKLKNYIIFD